MADYYVKQGSTAAILTATLKDADGAAVSLTGATVKFSMRPAGNMTPKVNLATATPDPDQTANKGKVTYPWVAADVDTPGDYEAEFKVTFPDTKIQRFPTNGYVIVRVTDDVA